MDELSKNYLQKYLDGLKLGGNKWFFCNLPLLCILYKSLEKYDKITKSFYKNTTCLFTILTNIIQAKTKQNKKTKKNFFKWTWVSRVALVVKNPPANAGDARDMSLIPGLGRSPEVRNGTPPQYSCLENSMGRGARQAIVHGVEKRQKWFRD